MSFQSSDDENELQYIQEVDHWRPLQQELRQFARDILAKIHQKQKLAEENEDAHRDSAISVAAILSGWELGAKPTKILDISTDRSKSPAFPVMPVVTLPSSSNSSYPAWNRCSFKRPEAFIKYGVEGTMADHVFLNIFNEPFAHEVIFGDFALHKVPEMFDPVFYEATQHMAEAYERKILRVTKCWIFAMQHLPPPVTKITAQALVAERCVPKWFVEAVLDCLKAVVGAITGGHVEWDAHIGVARAEAVTETEGQSSSNMDPRKSCKGQK